MSRAGDNPEAQGLLQKALYEKGQNLLNEKDFEGAIQAFEQIVGYSDADNQVLHVYYEWGEDLLKKGELDKADVAFTKAEGYTGAADGVKEVKYRKADQHVKKGEYAKAYMLYKEIRDYRDVASILKDNANFKQVYLDDFKTVGNIVTFGHYEQDNVRENGAEDIEWIVLARDGKHILLLSRYALDTMRYNTRQIDVTWEKSGMRKWLNSDFLNTAFSNNEKKVILTTRVDNSSSQGNKKWKIKGGNNTQDKVFLLSYAESGKYFSKDADRKCQPTTYAIGNGAYQTRGFCYWWLRSPGSYKKGAAYVGPVGSRSDNYVNYSHYTVRPAIWIDLDSDNF